MEKNKIYQINNKINKIYKSNNHVVDLHDILRNIYSTRISEAITEAIKNYPGDKAGLLELALCDGNEELISGVLSYFNIYAPARLKQELIQEGILFMIIKRNDPCPIVFINNYYGRYLYDIGIYNEELIRWTTDPNNDIGQRNIRTVCNYYFDLIALHDRQGEKELHPFLDKFNNLSRGDEYNLKRGYKTDINSYCKAVNEILADPVFRGIMQRLSAGNLKQTS